MIEEDTTVDSQIEPLKEGETPEVFAVSVTLAIPAAVKDIGAAIGKKMWATAAIRDRLEKAASKSIDQTIASIVREKAETIVEGVIEKPPVGRFGQVEFDFRKFVHAKIKEWLSSTGHLEGIVEDIIREEVKVLQSEARLQIRAAIEAEAQKAVDAVEKAAVREASKAFEDALKQGMGKVSR